jgi:flagellar biosynthesis repressor protein FlbT
MALKLSLKANEKLIIAGAVIRNGSHHAEIYIENDVPILRQKDIMTEADANTPSRRLYFIVQLIYIDRENIQSYLESLGQLVDDIATAAPSCRQYLHEISEHIVAGRLYQALKSARHLVEHETDLLNRAQTDTPLNC